MKNLKTMYLALLIISAFSISACQLLQPATKPAEKDGVCYTDGAPGLVDPDCPPSPKPSK